MLHALGLLHEHQRPDRDQYIDVNMTAVTYYGLSKQLEKESFLWFWIIELRLDQFTKVDSTQFKSYVT